MRTITPEEVIKALPRILKEHPEIKVELYQILSQEYVTRAELKEYMERSDKRFERIDKRFEEMDRRFNALVQEMRAFREDTNRRFEDLHSWVGIVVGGFQRRAGKGLEEAIAGTLRIAIHRPDIKSEKIILRERIIDDKGLIGPKGRGV